MKEQEESVFGAAYEDVVYQDSTDDGQDASIFEEETDTQDELIAESKRLGQHLTLLTALAQMWKRVALHGLSLDEDDAKVSSVWRFSKTGLGKPPFSGPA